MKTFKEFLEESTQVTEALIDKLEKFAGKEIKPGRVTIKGYPVDVADSDGSYIEMDAVDRAAVEGLVKALRKDGFNAKRVGNLGILVKESLAEAKYELENAGLELMEQTQVNEAFANTKEKNLSKSEIEALPVGADFYYNGYEAKKVSDSKVEIKYPMRPSTKVPISSLKESLAGTKYELENAGLELME